MKAKNDAFFDTIAAPVIYENDSPYRLMMYKLNYIGYLPNNGRLAGGKIDERLIADAKKQAIVDFKEYARQLQERADAIEHRIIDDVYRIVNNYKDRDTAIRDLKITLLKMNRFTRNQLLFIAVPKYSLRDVNMLHDKAKHETMIERLNDNNGRDVQMFYRALMEHTVWILRQLTRRKAGQFLLHMVNIIADKFSLDLPWRTPLEGLCGSLQAVSLPAELGPLVELMAENVHDVWMKTRLEQGWTYGEERNDLLKTHPCLVPYDELPESEKIYDRQTSIESINYILSHGYRIVKVE